MAWRIGIDIGGTFTDVAMVEEDTGRIEIAKVPDHATRFRPGRDRRPAPGPGRQRHRPAARSRCWPTPPRWSPTPCWRRRAPAPASSPRAAFATCWNCAAPPAPTCTTCSRTRPACWCPAATASRSPNASTPRARWSRRWRRTGNPALIEAIREAGLQTVGVSFLFSFLNDAHERRVGADPARRPARRRRVPVLRGAAGNPRVRARQHHRGVRLCRPAARLLPGAPAAGRQPARPAGAAGDGLLRRRVRHRRGAAHARRRGGIRPRRRRGGRGAGRPATGPAQPDLLRHGRHHRQGQRDRRRARSRSPRNTRSAAPPTPSAGCTAPATRSACR